MVEDTEMNFSGSEEMNHIIEHIREKAEAFSQLECHMFDNLRQNSIYTGFRSYCLLRLINEFNVDFFKQFNVVLNGLDNLDARRQPHLPGYWHPIDQE